MLKIEMASSEIVILYPSGRGRFVYQLCSFGKLDGYHYASLPITAYMYMGYIKEQHVHVFLFRLGS